MSSPRRVADAATSITPYPFVVRQGASNPSSDNVEGRQGKFKKPKPAPKPESRIPRPDEGMRFNLGPRSFRIPSNNRGGRQSRFMSGRQDIGYTEDQEGIPNYPPPSFQEAMTSPPLSVCSSTTSLVPAPTIPLVIPALVLPVEQVAAGSAAENPAHETIAPDNGSDSDSIVMVDPPDSVPTCVDDILSMSEEPRSRFGVNFPASPSPKSSQAQTGSIPANSQTSNLRRPLPLNLDPQAVSSEDFAQFSPTRSKRRLLSLSPLKTIFPSKFSGQRDRAMSAHPTPQSSPLYPASRSVFFKSSTSLSSPSIFSFTQSESGKGEGLRRVFSHKAKERVETPGIPEKLDAWEVVVKDDPEEKTSAESNEDDIHPPSLMSAMQSISASSPAYIGTSPTRSQSFTFGTRSAPRATQLPASIVTNGQNMQTASYSSQSLSLRDVKAPLFDRRVKRAPKPPPVPEVVESPAHPLPLPPVIEGPAVVLGPPLTTVRVREGAAITRPTSPPAASISRHPAQVTIPSPLRIDSKPPSLVEGEPASPSPSPSTIHQQALSTPLPVTPVNRAHFEYGPDNITRPPARSIPDLLTDSISENDVYCCHCAGVSPSPSVSVMTVNGSIKPAIPEEPITPSRHHYTGRPLPRPPPSLASRPVIDSTYAGAIPESLGHQPNIRDRSSPALTEGLLIDLDDTSYDKLPGNEASTPSHDSRFRSQTHLPTTPSSSSDTELLVDINTESPTIVPSPRNGLSLIVAPTPLTLPMTQLSQLTELDLLVSQVEEGHRSGSDYETLLLLGEVLGPASPTHPRTVPPQTSTSQTANDNDNISLIGRVEVKRRRTLNDGRVKVKLSLMNIAVNKCGICLSQFKNGDMAGLTSQCNHAFHETCLGKWLPRSKTCPMCRVSLDADAR